MEEEKSTKKVNGWNTFWKSFFSSIGKDIKNLFTKRMLKLIGLFIMYIVPLATIIIMYMQKKPDSWGFSLVAIPVIVIMLFSYWGSFRSWLNGKLIKMELENTIQKGKHIAFILLAKVLQLAMTILPFIICFLLFQELEKLSLVISYLFLFVAICQVVGGMFIIGDTILNLNK